MGVINVYRSEAKVDDRWGSVTFKYNGKMYTAYRGAEKLEKYKGEFFQVEIVQDVFGRLWYSIVEK